FISLSSCLRSSIPLAFSLRKEKFQARENSTETADSRSPPIQAFPPALGNSTALLIPPGNPPSTLLYDLPGSSFARNREDLGRNTAPLLSESEDSQLCKPGFFLWPLAVCSPSAPLPPHSPRTTHPRHPIKTRQALPRKDPAAAACAWIPTGSSL